MVTGEATAKLVLSLQADDLAAGAVTTSTSAALVPLAEPGVLEHVSPGSWEVPSPGKAQRREGGIKAR